MPREHGEPRVTDPCQGSREGKKRKREEAYGGSVAGRERLGPSEHDDTAVARLGSHGVGQASAGFGYGDALVEAHQGRQVRVCAALCGKRKEERKTVTMSKRVRSVSKGQ